MKRKLLTLVAFLLILVSLSSQNDYPKLTLINSDTLVLFEPNNVRKMHKVFLQLDSTIDVNENIRTRNDYLNQSVVSLNLIIEEQDSIIGNNNKIFGKLESSNKKLLEVNKKQEKHINFLKKVRNLYGGVGLLSGVVITLLIVN